MKLIRALYSKIGFYALLGLLLLMVPEKGIAQVSNPDIQKVKSQYDAIKFNDAISTADSLLKFPRSFAAQELAFLHRYTALSFYNLGEEDSARVHFLSMLSLRPDTELDPGEISPKIIDFFDQIKKDYSLLTYETDEAAFSKYIIEKDLRPGAAWRSAGCFPGGGQFYKGQKTKGIILGGAFWGSFTAVIIAAVRESDAKQQYVDATEPGSITDSYDSYNQWFKTRQILTITTTALWVAAVGDAALSAYAIPAIAFHKDEGILLTLRFQLNSPH